MYYRIEKGFIDNKYYIGITSTDKHVIKMIDEAVNRFLAEYEKPKIKEKLEKEKDHGYFSMS